MSTFILGLINHAFTASWLIAAVILARFLLKKAPKWISCLLWGLVLVRLVFPFRIESSFSLVPEIHMLPAQTEYARGGDMAKESQVLENSKGISDISEEIPGIRQDADSFPGEKFLAENPQDNENSEEREAAVREGNAAVLWYDDAEYGRERDNAEYGRKQDDDAEYTMARDGEKMPERDEPWKTGICVFAGIWIAGVTIMLAYAWISFRQLKRKVSASVRITGNLYRCDEIKSPFILGIIRPGIYLPSGLEAGMEECVLVHERTHIRRGDHIWKPLGFLVLAVYWFHPLCWIAYMLLCRDIEYACDERATKDMDHERRAAYCQALLDMGSGRRRIAACPVAFGEVGVKERVKTVLNYKKPAFWIVLAALVVCGIVVLCFMTSPRRQAEDDLQKESDSAQIADRQGQGAAGNMEGTEDMAGTEDAAGNAGEAPSFLYGLRGYSGYLDEAYGWTEWEYFADWDFDKDGKTDRIYREYREEDQRADYTIEFGNGKKIVMEGAYDSGTPNLQVEDLDQDGDLEIAFSVGYPFSTNPFAGGEFWIYDYNAEYDRWQRIRTPFGLAGGNLGKNYLQIEFLRPEGNVVHMRVLANDFEQDVDLGEGYVPFSWGDYADTEDCLVSSIRIIDDGEGNVIRCLTEPFPRAGRTLVFDLVYRGGQSYQIENMVLIGGANWSRENREELEKFVSRWADAFSARDGKRIQQMSSSEVRNDLIRRGILRAEGHTVVFEDSGSMPEWPDGKRGTRITWGDEDGTADILYYTWSSDSKLCVWGERISCAGSYGMCHVIREELHIYDNIASGEEFLEAYPDGINHTLMDFAENGMGEELNRNALLDSSFASRGLFEPESAARILLCLIDNENKVKLETVEDDNLANGVCVRITFLEDGIEEKIAMIQPWGEIGIWIPQDYPVQEAAVEAVTYTPSIWNPQSEGQTDDPGWKSGLGELIKMSYGEFKMRYGDSARFSHGGYFRTSKGAETGNLELEFPGTWTEDYTDCILKDDARVYLVMGTLGDFLEDYDRELSQYELLDRVNPDAWLKIKASAGTAYYVSAQWYLTLPVEIDGNEETYEMLEIAYDDSTGKLGPDTIAWIRITDQMSEEMLPAGKMTELTSYIDGYKGYLLKLGDPAMGYMPKYLYQTADGGRTWKKGMDITDIVHNYPKQLFFLSDTEGYILTDYHGYEDCLYRTMDGGILWEQVSLGELFENEDYRYLEAVSMTEGKNGIYYLYLRLHLENDVIKKVRLWLHEGEWELE